MDVAIRELDLMAQEHSRRLGNRAYCGVAQFAGSRLEDRPAALWAKGGIMDVVCDKGLRLENDIFLCANLLLR